MTVKEASEKFNISRDEIRKLCRESQNSIVKYVKANKNVYWDIDDDTKVIMTKEQILHSLLQLLKYKNNPNNVVSRRTFPNDEISIMVFDYLSTLGYVSARESNSITLMECLKTIALTEEGFNALLIPMIKKQKGNINPVMFAFDNNITINTGLVNL